MSKTHLDELSKQEPEVAEYIKDHEDEARHCSGDCSDCSKVNTCFN